MTDNYGVTTDVVDLRCTVHPARLFARLRSEGAAPQVVDGNLVEFACRDCRNAARAEGRPVKRVLHRYNLVGEMVESVEVYEDSEADT